MYLESLPEFNPENEIISMGWKNLKEHFDIKHIVHVTPSGISIGSSFIPDLVSINLETGAVFENGTFKGFLRDNYPALNEAPASEILALIKAPDSFSQSLPVFTYDRGEILVTFCEQYNFPNVTHDGILMYDNTFFQDKAKAIEKASENERCKIEYADQRIQQLSLEIDNARELRNTAKANIAALEALALIR